MTYHYGEAREWFRAKITNRAGSPVFWRSQVVCPFTACLMLAISLNSIIDDTCDESLRAEIGRFPPSEIVRSWTQFGRAHYFWLNSQEKLHPNATEIRTWK